MLPILSASLISIEINDSLNGVRISAKLAQSRYALMTQSNHFTAKCITRQFRVLRKAQQIDRPLLRRR